MRPKPPQRSRCITIALQVTQTCKRQVGCLSSLQMAALQKVNPSEK